ncbi:MAG: polysaccharide deacetylase family protein [Chloroflexi bacterium]|nr:polysaccharide deacetylase family protein [Chloroflexota bacterium]
MPYARRVTLGHSGLKRRVATLIVQAASRVGFLHGYGAVRSRLAQGRVAIVMYHRIDRPTHYPWSLTPIVPEEFEREIRYLCRRFRVISLEELSAALSGHGALPQNAAVITIDDGYRDVYLNGYPVLKEYNVPATIFLTTGHIDCPRLFWWDEVSYVIHNARADSLDAGELGSYHLRAGDDRPALARAIIRGLKKLPGQEKDQLIERLVASSGVVIPSGLAEEMVMSWDEVREMRASGIQFGAHTVNHPILTRVPIAVARREILDSKHRIEEELNCPVKTFCFPNGEPDDSSAEIEEVLESAGFACAVTTSPAAFVRPDALPYRLPRVPGASTFDKFNLIMSGFYLDLTATRRHLSRSRFSSQS